MVHENKIERYVCFNANQVRDEIYKACAELSSHCFSYYEYEIALKVITNCLFGCTWTIPPESRGHVEFSEDNQPKEVAQFDNTLPTRKAIQKMSE